MRAAADILSTLPEPLLGLILSKIPIREAVRCSVLSKRWRFLYAQIPQLTLSPFLLLGSVNRYSDPLSLTTVEKIISNLLLLHSSDLEAFHLFNYNSDSYDLEDFHLFNYISECRYKDSNWHFTRQSEWLWVRYVASKNVQNMTLCGSPLKSPVKKILPPALFYCSRLTTLTLYNYILTAIPTHFSRFNHLTACSFIGMEFTDDSLSRFISHTPFLEDLGIFHYVGLTKPVISAPNLKNLYIRGVEVEAITINCPKLRTLELFQGLGPSGNHRLIMTHDLRINGVLFQELSFSIYEIENDWESNIVGLWLDWSAKPLHFSTDRFLEIVGTFKTLKALYIMNWSLLERERHMVELVHKLLERLPALERLEVDETLDLELVRDPMLPCTTSLLANLRKVKLSIIQIDRGEIAVLRNLLESASVLEIMEVKLPYLWQQGKANAFLKKLLYLRRASTGARIFVKDFDFI